MADTIKTSTVDGNTDTKTEITQTTEKLGTPHEAKAIPDAKVLEQSFAQTHSQDFYTKSINEITGGKKTLIRPGAGVDTVAPTKLVQIDDYNQNDQGGGDRSLQPNYFQRAINISNVDTNYLKPTTENASKGFKQITATLQDILWVQNFIASNPTTYDDLVAKFEPTITRYEYLLIYNEIKRLFDITNGKKAFDLYDTTTQTATMDFPTVNNIVYNGSTGSDNIAEAIANVQYVMETTLSDNYTYMIGQDGTSGRALVEGSMSNCNENDWELYVNPYDKKLWTTLLRNWSIREDNVSADEKNRLIGFVNRLKTLPIRLANPERNVIKATINSQVIYFQLQLKNASADGSNPNLNEYNFIELSDINPLTKNETPIASDVSFSIFGKYGNQILATIGGTQYTGTFEYVASSYDTNFIPRNTVYGIYKNQDHDGIFTLYNLDITNVQDWVKSLSKDKYFNLGINVVSANTTRIFVYRDAGFSKTASISTN